MASKLSFNSKHSSSLESPIRFHEYTCETTPTRGIRLQTKHLECHIRNTPNFVSAKGE